MQTIESVVSCGLGSGSLADFQKNGWRFEITADNRVIPTTFDRDSTGRPTFESAQQALDTATYIDLSGY